jgi:hypothetical protein
MNPEVSMARLLDLLISPPIPVSAANLKKLGKFTKHLVGTEHDHDQGDHDPHGGGKSLGPRPEGDRDQERAWKQEVRRALSRGELTQAEAEALGFYVGGHAQDSGWQPLPDNLYHVTTAWTEVDAHGLKSRDELNQSRGKGLGGGESDTISFTTDIDIANQIKAAMLEAHQVATGNKTIEDMISEAKEGGFYEKMLDYWNGKDDLLQKLIAGPRERTKHIGLAWGETPPDGDHTKRPRYSYTPEQISEMVGHDDWEPTRTLTHKETGQEAIVSVKYTETQDEWREAVFDVYKTFAAYRAWNGGPMDPLFFSSDVAGLAAIDPDEIAIIHVRPKPGAQGYQLSALGEWRTVDGSAVEVQNSGWLN